MRGKSSDIGATRVAQNGYHYTRTDEGWKLTHRLVAEQSMGRKLGPDEFVRFEDKDKTNLDPSNIRVRKRRDGQSYKAKRKAQLEARIDELQSEVEDLSSQGL